VNRGPLITKTTGRFMSQYISVNTDPVKEAENAKQRSIIQEKIDKSEALTVDEQYFYCENIKLEYCRSDPKCEDEYYKRVYLQRDRLETIFQIDGVDRNRFRILVRHWEKRILGSSQHDKLLHPSAVETREEIKSLKKDYTSMKGVLKDKYEKEYFDLLAWSRYRYGVVRESFERDIKGDFYPLYLNGKEIRFDSDSLTHILTRHFGHIMKPYKSKKDHFYDVFAHDKLHLNFEDLFRKIDNSGLYAADPIEEINFRFKGGIYKIYVNKKEVYLPGVTGAQYFFRLQTFFPVSETQMLNKINVNYIEKIIDNELSVFVLKPAS
jgi:hypothetical protein